MRLVHAIIIGCAILGGPSCGGGGHPEASRSAPTANGLPESIVENSAPESAESADATVLVTVEFIARDSGTLDLLEASAWSVRVVHVNGVRGAGPAGRQDGAAAGLAGDGGSRILEDGRVVIGPIPTGTYDVFWEAPGFLPLTRTLTFREDVTNRVDAALDPAGGP